MPTDRSGVGDSPAEALKRALDFLLASAALLLLLPIFLAVAFAIKFDSSGPIFYVQERIGLNRRRFRNGIPHGRDRRRGDCFGQPFRMYKFRSMVVDAERHTGPVWSSAQDTRVTRVGRILRRTRLDEFPQLWNVIRGEMSLVGPRPERPTFVRSLARSIPEYPERQTVLPGITGLAQVSSSYDTSIESVKRKLQYDLFYLRNRRMSLDLKIMAVTVKLMARSAGAN